MAKKKFSFDKLTGSTSKKEAPAPAPVENEYKMLRIRKSTHHLLKIQASVLGISILEYVDKLVKEKEKSPQ
jgi:predicted HicB family RNase H-like nuclease